MAQSIAQLPIKNILVNRRGALGDYIAGTVGIRELREHWPDAKITLLATAFSKNVMPEGTLIDELIDWDQTFKKEGYAKSVIGLWGKKFDLALNLRFVSEGDGIIAKLSGAKYVAGIGPKGVRWLYTHKPPLPQKRIHEYDAILQTVASLGIPVTKPRPYIYISDQAQNKVQQWLAEKGLKPKGFMVLSPYASSGGKAWPPEQYAQLVKLLGTSYPNVPIVVTYSPSEEKDLDQWLSELEHPHLLKTFPTTVTEVAALISQAGLLICNNSGPLNIGMATGTPIVCVSSTSPVAWGAGEGNLTLYPDITEEKARWYDQEANAQDIRAMMLSMTPEWAHASLKDYVASRQLF